MGSELDWSRIRDSWLPSHPSARRRSGGEPQVVSRHVRRRPIEAERTTRRGQVFEPQRLAAGAEGRRCRAQPGACVSTTSVGPSPMSEREGRRSHRQGRQADRAACGAEPHRRLCRRSGWRAHRNGSGPEGRRTGRALITVGLRPTPRLGRLAGPPRPAPLPRGRAVRAAVMLDESRILVCAVITASDVRCDEPRPGPGNDGVET